MTFEVWFTCPSWSLHLRKCHRISQQIAASQSRRLGNSQQAARHYGPIVWRCMNCKAGGICSGTTFAWSYFLRSCAVVPQPVASILLQWTGCCGGRTVVEKRDRRSSSRIYGWRNLGARFGSCAMAEPTLKQTQQVVSYPAFVGVSSMLGSPQCVKKAQSVLLIQGGANVGLQLWVPKTAFVLVLFLY